MKKYEFRLQTVLDLREKALEEKLLELSKAMNIYHAQLAKQKKSEEKKKSLTSELNEFYQSGEAIDIAQISLYRNYIQKIDKDITAQAGLIKSIEKLIKEKQNEVNIAMQNKKIMEKLKEKEEKQYYENIEYMEKKEIDDIAISRYKKQI